MDVVNFIFNAENLRTLFLFVALIAGFVWQGKLFDQKLRASEGRLRQEMNGLGVSLRQEMNALAASLRQEMDERFTAFHKMLKENDFAHLNRTIKELTFMLQKNGILKVEDKTHIDSHLDE